MAKKSKNKSTSNKQTPRLYWEQVRKYKPSLVIMAICIPASSILFDTIVPYYLSLAVGTFSGHSGDFRAYITVAAIAAGAGVIINLTGYQVAARHEAKVRSGLAHSTMLTLLNKDSAFFANQKIGALTGKFIDFIGGHVDIQALLTMRVAAFVFNVSLGLILISIHTPLLALLVCGLVIWLLFQVKVSRMLRENLRNQRKHLRAEMHGAAADMITNYATIKTFAAEEHEVAMLDKINSDYGRAYIKDFTWMSVDGTARMAIMNTVQIVAVVVIAGLLSSGQLGLGIAIFTIAYMQRLATQLFVLGEMIFGYDKIMLDVSPMADILVESPRVTDASTAKLNIKDATVRFNNVNYSYEDAKDTLVLNNFSLTIPAGQKVGLVGHSGAGKTTLTRLLLRFDDIDSGEIMINNQDIAMVTQKSLRQAISYVPQEPMLFHRSLRDNIGYGKPGASDTEIITATKQANAWDFISKLPRGLDTIVGERGIKLCGGQRQRIAIARALLKDAPILILDEATSALDSESEALIQQSFNVLMSGRTSIVVAHRLSTLRHMDRIIVIDEGKITEDGTHIELLNCGGTYAKLWERQSGGFIEE